jgi:hypothetical protein
MAEGRMAVLETVCQARRAERALPAVAQEAYVLDVFIRHVAEVEAFRSRALTGEGYPSLALDTRISEPPRSYDVDDHRTPRRPVGWPRDARNEDLLTERPAVGNLRSCHNAQADLLRKQQVRSSNLRVGSSFLPSS